MPRLLPSSILITLVAFSSAQSIFINKVPDYSSLPSCAEIPLSTIVRNMEQGCGDGGKTTSYSCFCTASSAVFLSKISKAVASECASATAGVGEALDVFHSYCAMGANGTISSVPAMATGTGTGTGSNATSAATNGTVSMTGSPTPTQGPTETAAFSETTTATNTTSAGRLMAVCDVGMVGLWVVLLGVFSML